MYKKLTEEISPKVGGTITLKQMRELWNTIADTSFSPPATHLYMADEKGVWRKYKIGSRRIKQIVKFYAKK